MLLCNASGVFVGKLVAPKKKEKPQVKGEDKVMAPEEVSSMVLTKMKDMLSARKTWGNGGRN